jgi:hypothetical protein
VECNVSFGDLASTIDDQTILEIQGGDGGLSNLQVDDDATLSTDSNEIKWLKIAGVNGIIVEGKIEIDGEILTSWSIMQVTLIHAYFFLY